MRGVLRCGSFLVIVLSGVDLDVEFEHRLFLFQEIELHKAQWSALFEPFMFFESYRNYLQIDIVAANTDDLLSWKGWVLSRLRQLTLMVMC